MQEVSWRVAGQLLVAALAFGFLAAGLRGLIVYPANSVSIVIITAATLAGAVAVPKKYWSLAFAAATAFAAISVLATALRFFAGIQVDTSITPHASPMPARFYWALLYFIPIIIHLIIQFGPSVRRRPRS